MQYMYVHERILTWGMKKAAESEETMLMITTTSTSTKGLKLWHTQPPRP